jgi:YD repeat-containing protein
VPGNASTGPVVVTVNNVASNGVNFTLTTTGTISGKVTRASDGTVVSGAQVEAVQSGSLKASTTTDTNGAYSLANLTPGLYDVQVFANGYLSGKQSAAEVTAGATTTVNIILGVPVIASLAPSSGPVGTTVTITGSNFGAAQGSSTVTFNGTAATPTSWSNASIVAPVPTGATTGPVVVTVAATASNTVTFTVGTGTITGTVTQASGGAAISGALVEVLQSNVVKTSTTTATNGTYTISNLSPGSYDLRFSATGFGTTIQAGNNVTANGSITVNAALSSAGTVSGLVTIAGGSTPISGATVTAFQGVDTAGTATTNGTGNYSIATLSAGSYTVQAAATGYNSQSQTGVSVTAGATTTTNFSLAGQHVVSYFYDDLSRLIGASDSPSNTAVYSYDAVGNLLSIANNPTSQVSIIGFSPQSGPVGASVTISGTAFSPTASLNTVLFNATSATVTSATATQLVATVPTGATTGPIKVTAPAGSATSSSSFTVATSSGTPAITSFTPTINNAGTTVTVSGSNFSATASNEKVEINASLSAISSAATTSVSVTVPANTTSGHISVTTPTGRATSSDYFYVVPSGYQASNVVFAGTLPFTTSLSSGTSVTFAAGQIAIFVFEGTAGQRITLQANWSAVNTNVTRSILNPDGSVLVSGGSSLSTWHTATQTLPTTGTYTIVDIPGGAGTDTLYLFQVPPDVTGAIVADGLTGPTVTVNTTFGQKGYLTFSGTQGQRISLNMTQGNYVCGCCASGVNVTIFSPDGTTLGSQSCIASAGFLDQKYLPVGGASTIKVDPQDLNNGTITLQLYSVPPDVTGSVSINGPSFPANIQIPGQNAQITFSGTAGQKVTGHLTVGPSFPGCYGLSLFAPGVDPYSGTQALASGGQCGGFSVDLPQVTLASTGTYLLFFDLGGAAVGVGNVSVTSP